MGYSRLFCCVSGGYAQGSTHCRRPSAHGTGRFRSRYPRGGRLEGAMGVVGSYAFQSTSPRRGRQQTYPDHSTTNASVLMRFAQKRPKKPRIIPDDFPCNAYLCRFQGANLPDKSCLLALRTGGMPYILELSARGDGSVSCLCGHTRLPPFQGYCPSGAVPSLSWIARIFR